MKIKDDRGFTGVDVAIATVVIIVFLGLIAGLFYNLASTSTRVERKTRATNLAIEIIEALKVTNFYDLVSTEADQMSIERLNTLASKEISIPNGYSYKILIEDYLNGGVVKILKVEITYKQGNEDENVYIETLVKNADMLNVAGIYVTLYTDGTLAFSSSEEPISGKTVEKTYGNIANKVFTIENSNEIPWITDTSKILTADIVDPISPISTGGWFANCTI